VPVGRFDLADDALAVASFEPQQVAGFRAGQVPALASGTDDERVDGTIRVDLEVQHRPRVVQEVGQVDAAFGHRRAVEGDVAEHQPGVAGIVAVLVGDRIDHLAPDLAGMEEACARRAGAIAGTGGRQGGKHREHDDRDAVAGHHGLLCSGGWASRPWPPLAMATPEPRGRGQPAAGDCPRRRARA